MIYSLGILSLILLGLVLQHGLLAKGPRWMAYFWLGLGGSIVYGLVSAPYRLARMISDWAHWIG